MTSFRQIPRSLGSAAQFTEFANSTRASVEGRSGEQLFRLELNNGEFNLLKK
jgi:hypothetical protein